MDIPFTCWVALADRRNIGEVDDEHNGVYLIANRVRRKHYPNVIDRKIIYMGRAANLKSRINAFERACESFYASHAGGNTYHKMNINPQFDDLIINYKRRGYTKRERKEAYARYLRRHPAIGQRWREKRNNLSVSIWIPGYGNLGRFSRLPEEYQLAFVEMKLQANFFLEHNRLPRCNKRIG